MSPHLQKWRHTFRCVADVLLSKLFEPPCAACGATLARPLDGAVCELCWASIHRITSPVCDRCGDPVPFALGQPGSRIICHRCASSAHAVDRTRAVGSYEGRLRDIIHALKYDARRSIGPRLAAMMRVAGRDLLDKADCVVPVPLHPRRERARGFNQADDLARGLGAPVYRLLERSVATAPQVELPADARAINVRGAFRLERSRPWRLSARRPIPHVIVLVDDVATTGATLEACAAVLKAAGARQVRALTAARVVTGRR